MTNSRLCSLEDLLGRGDLASLVSGARERSALKAAVCALLPPAEAEQVIGAHWDDDGRLVLSVSSGNWAARLRFRQAELGAEQVRVRVAPRGS
jgi:predicted nucleic acid-binding Zn ribbon protein